MKPTVINNSNSENMNPNHDFKGPDGNSSNNTTNTGQERRFPQFRHGFGFDDTDDDMFSHIRSRMNRPNPFDWRKRRGSGQGVATDPYDQYFHDDVDFPHFGSTWDAFHRAGNKRSQHPSEVNDRSGFFDYLPSEFRQYMPDNFGFGGGMRNHPSAHHQSSQQNHPAQQPPQQQQQAQQPNYEQNNLRSNLCDAAIQTEDLGAGASSNNTNNSNNQNNGSNQYRPENAGNDHGNNGSQFSNSSSSSSSYSTPHGNQVHMSTSTNGPGSFASASAGNGPNQYYQQSPNNYQYYQHQNPYAGHSAPQQNQFHYQQQQAPPPPPPQPTAPSSNQGDNFVRNVPIFFEGSNVPVNQSNSTQATSPPTRPRPEPFQSREAFHQTQQPSEPQQSQPSQEQSQTDGPPQTPHTADCIAKIQAIQRDVLTLMCAVEQFGGKRGDKEYAYLDEMLTRNLLKLDTIDTNGKESIRMARKEAIKCIQASIAVLEAKADLHLNANKDADGEVTTEAAVTNTETSDNNNSTDKNDNSVAEKNDENKESNNKTNDPKSDESVQAEEIAKEGQNAGKSSEANEAGKNVDIPNVDAAVENTNANNEQVDKVAKDDDSNKATDETKSTKC